MDKLLGRRVSQVFFFVLVSLIALNHYLGEMGKAIPFIGSSSLHSICPYGGVEAFVALFKYDTWVKKIHPSSMVMFVIVLVISLIFGAVFCSYMCPLGSVQEWIGKIGKKIFKKRYNYFIPGKVHNVLKYFRYFVLVFTVYLTTQSLRLVFLEVDPYYALFNFWSDEATIGGIIVLVVIVLMSLFVERPWCKYACPFGALLGLTNFISIFKIRRNHATCIGCKKCDRICPMNINISEKEVITDPMCIKCHQCTSEVACPVPETVEYREKGTLLKGLELSTKTVAIGVIIILFSGILISKASGFWLVESTKEPSKISEGKFEGMANPEDIRGSYSFGDIENVFGIPADRTAKAFNIISDQPENIKAKDLEEVFTDLEEGMEIGTGSVRTFVYLYIGLPYEEIEYLPSTAIEVLMEDNKIDVDTKMNLSDYIIEIDTAGKKITHEESEDGNAHIDEDGSHDDIEMVEVKGKTTVKEVVDAGIPIEEIESILGVKVTNVNLTVRDICEQNDLSFSEKKGEINVLLSK